MKRILFTLPAVVALATCLAFAQYQPGQNQPGQGQPPQTQPGQEQPGQNQPSQPQQMPQGQQPSQPQQQQPAGHGQTGMSSQQLQAAFQRTFEKYPELSNVKVNVADDKINISGTVPSQADKDKVHRTAEANADGRKIVDDDLKVGGGGESKPASPPSSTPPSSTPPQSTPPPSTPPR